VTVNVSGLGAKAVTKNGTTALVANNIISGQTVEITYDGTEFQLGQVSFATSNNNFTGSVNTFDSGLSYWFPQNLMVTASVSGNALTVALKTKAGTDPTSTDPIIIPFRSSTLTSGAYTARKVTAATSMTVSNGSSLGILASSAGRVYIGAVDNSGTVELCVWTSVNYGFANPPDISQLKYFSESDLQTTTAEGGAGAADSSATLYSTTARASVPFRILGYIEITAGGSNAWSNSPTVIHTMGPFSPCTGKIVQRDETRANTSSTGTTVLPFDNTTPQNTEGDQYLSKAFTGTSGLNILEVDINVTVSSSVINNMTAALFKDANAGAFCARGVSAAAANNNVTISFLYTEQPATSSVTYKLRCGGNGAGTTTFNGNAGGGLFNGSMNSYMKFTEIFT
jgi:hypothetical protein